MGTSETFRSLSSEISAAAVAAAVIAGLLLWVAWSAATFLWWAPRRLERALRAQGLVGTRYRFPAGDVKENIRLMREALVHPLPLSHCILPRISPFSHGIINRYGKSCITWMGPTPNVIIMNPDLIREILTSKSDHFEKQKMTPQVKLVASGLIGYDGEKWAKHRRIVNPAFHIEKLKRMQPAFLSSCSELIRRWEKLIDLDKTCEVDVWPAFRRLACDVISKTAFGGSYEEGIRISELQEEQAKLFFLSFRTMFIPGFRFLPTPMNRRRNQIDREVRCRLRGMIEKRQKAIKSGEKNSNDLLGVLLDSNLKQFEENGKSKNGGLTTEEIIDECKLFYFAGQETTSVLLNWTIFFLSIYPSWQERAREEVIEVFGENAPDFDNLNRLKIVSMILHEVLRLYPPVIVMARMTNKNTELGGITYPKGVVLALQTIFMHYDPETWGEDAHEFKPDRFSEGISKAAKNNQIAFFPFGWGPRICLGQNFALSEAKMCLSMILRSFRFELSPSYIHAPQNVITLQPQHGTPVVLRSLQ